MWGIKKIISEIENRIKNIKQHIPKIAEAWDSSLRERVIYYKKEMNIKIRELEETFQSCNNHQEIIKLSKEFEDIKKEVYLTISKYD